MGRRPLRATHADPCSRLPPAEAGLPREPRENFSVENFLSPNGGKISKSARDPAAEAAFPASPGKNFLAEKFLSPNDGKISKSDPARPGVRGSRPALAPRRPSPRASRKFQGRKFSKSKRRKNFQVRTRDPAPVPPVARERPFPLGLLSHEASSPGEYIPRVHVYTGFFLYEEYFPRGPVHEAATFSVLSRTRLSRPEEYFPRAFSHEAFSARRILLPWSDTRGLLGPG